MHAGGSLDNGRREGLPACNTLIVQGFVAPPNLIPVILLTHRSNCLARLGRPCQLVCVAGNAANRKRDASSQPLPPRMKRRRFARTEAATKATGRVFKEEARSARMAKAGRGPNPLSSSARHGTEAFGQRKRGGTGAFGQGNRIAAPDAFGRKGKRRNRPRPKGLGRNRSGRRRRLGDASGRKSGGWWQHRPPFAFGVPPLRSSPRRGHRQANAPHAAPAAMRGTPDDSPLSALDCTAPAV